MRHLILGLFCLGGSLCAVPAIAQDQNSQPSQQFSAHVGQPVSEAAEYINNKNFAAALSKLEGALAISGLSAYESSSIWQMKGSVHYELDQFDEAIRALQMAINSGGVKHDSQKQIELQIAQLYILGGQFQEGAEAFEQWYQGGGKLKDQHFEMLVQAWIKVDKPDKALPWAKKWFDRAAPKERKHFDLMNYLYNQMKDSRSQIEIVKDMIDLWPHERELWGNLASLYSSIDEELDAFIVNQLMYQAGFFKTESEILKLVQYYGYYEIPFQGAQILETELAGNIVSATPDNLKTLSNLWLQAREYERAIPVLTRITDVQPDKTSYAQLAESLISRGDCDGAEAAFESAIQLGYPAGTAWMLIGTCRYEEAQSFEKISCSSTELERKNTKRYLAQNVAKLAFEKVISPIELKADAKKWIRFISGEQQIVEEQCEREIWTPIEICYIDIQSGEKNRIFNNGKLVLSDTICERYLDDYYTEYGPKALQD